MNLGHSLGIKSFKNFPGGSNGQLKLQITTLTSASVEVKEGDGFFKIVDDSKSHGWCDQKCMKIYIEKTRNWMNEIAHKSSQWLACLLDGHFLVYFFFLCSILYTFLQSDETCIFLKKDMHFSIWNFSYGNKRLNVACLPFVGQISGIYWNIRLLGVAKEL